MSEMTEAEQLAMKIIEQAISSSIETLTAALSSAAKRGDIDMPIRTIIHSISEPDNGDGVQIMFKRANTPQKSH